MQLTSNLNSVGCNGAIYQPVNVNLPANIIIPTFVVDFTPFVKKCLPNSINLVNISSTGSRDLKSV